MRTRTGPQPGGFTLVEVLTALVVLAVLMAVAIPMWRNQQLRIRRADAINALIALQAAQDRYFGRHARYADASRMERPPPDGLGLASRAAQGHYRIELSVADDGLSYLATAHAPAATAAQPAPGTDAGDTRCVQFSIDQLGIRRALDAQGQDRSADCWR